MDEEVARYDKIYTDNPDKWGASGEGIYRDWIAYSIISKYFHEPETVLDIGCGNGHTIGFLSKHWSNAVYYGVDLSPVAIGIAKERMPDVEFVDGDYKELTLHCDLVTVMGVAEHFENLVGGLRRLKEYGNLIYLEVPDCLHLGRINGSPNSEEGFRETFFGGAQVEWHLKRRSWEERIRMAGLEILEFAAGYHGYHFVWMLK